MLANGLVPVAAVWNGPMSFAVPLSLSGAATVVKLLRKTDVPMDADVRQMPKAAISLKWFASMRLLAPLMFKPQAPPPSPSIVFRATTVSPPRVPIPACAYPLMTQSRMVTPSLITTAAPNEPRTMHSSTSELGPATTEPRPPPPLTVQLLLTVPEAALLLRISKNKAYELIRQHLIPAVHLGKTIRVPRQALERWILDQSQAATGNEDPTAVRWPSINALERSA